MGNRIKLSIGEFSKLCGVTVKTLRHYQKIGLLCPNEVDKWTKYRYYTVGQMQKMMQVRSMKNLGFSLEEITDLFDSECHRPDAEMLGIKIAQSEKELLKLQARITALKSMRDFHKKIKKMETITVQPLPEIIVASYRGRIADYGELFHLLPEVVGPEMARLGCECSEPGYCYTIEHDKEYRPTDIDIEYCEAVTKIGNDSSIVKFKTIPAVDKAVCMKAYGPYERLHDHYVELFKYLEDNGYEIADSPRCCYVDGIWNQEDPEKWLCIIQVPVK